jgi:hypothetical protein
VNGKAMQALAVLAIAGFGIALLPRRESAPLTERSPTNVTAPPDAALSPPAAGTVEHAAVAAATATVDTQWLLPDGSRVALLNGATNARPLAEAWPQDRPWSPIVRVERSDVGVDWYVHADGCRSTTEMRWRADIGRMDAVTRIGQPVAAPPIAPGSSR